MKVSTREVTMHGNPLTLLGTSLSVGDKAPDFNVLDNDLKPVNLSAYAGKTLVITSVPSLDTPVCAMETRKFNVEAGNLGEDVAVLTVSMDLPFAQKRWCAAEGIENVKTLSDHRDASLGMAYGVLIKELRLLARTVFIVDKNQIIRYIQFVDEVTNEPNYEEVLNALRDLK